MKPQRLASAFMPSVWVLFGGGGVVRNVLQTSDFPHGHGTLLSEDYLDR